MGCTAAGYPCLYLIGYRTYTARASIKCFFSKQINFGHRLCLEKDSVFIDGLKEVRHTMILIDYICLFQVKTVKNDATAKIICLLIFKCQVFARTIWVRFLNS